MRTADDARRDPRPGDVWKTDRADIYACTGRNPFAGRAGIKYTINGQGPFSDFLGRWHNLFLFTDTRANATPIHIAQKEE